MARDERKLLEGIAVDMTTGRHTTPEDRRRALDEIRTLSDMELVDLICR